MSATQYLVYESPIITYSPENPQCLIILPPREYNNFIELGDNSQEVSEEWARVKNGGIPSILVIVFIFGGVHEMWERWEGWVGDMRTVLATDPDSHMLLLFVNILDIELALGSVFMNDSKFRMRTFFVNLETFGGLIKGLIAIARHGVNIVMSESAHDMSECKC